MSHRTGIGGVEHDHMDHHGLDPMPVQGSHDALNVGTVLGGRGTVDAGTDPWAALPGNDSQVESQFVTRAGETEALGVRPFPRRGGGRHNGRR